MFYFASGPLAIYEYLNNLQCSLTLSICHVLKCSQRSCLQPSTLGFPFWKKMWCEEGSTWLCAALSSPERHLRDHKLSVLPVPQTHRCASTGTQRMQRKHMQPIPFHFHAPPATLPTSSTPLEPDHKVCTVKAPQFCFLQTFRVCSPFNG